MTSIVVVVESLSRVQLFVTPCTVASQAPLSMEFPRQESWSQSPFPPPGDPRSSPGTGRGDGAHREPLVEVGNAPGARQGRGDPGRRGS